MTSRISRRALLLAGAAAAGGLVVAIRLRRPPPLPTGPASDHPFAPNAYLHLDGDGLVHVVVPQTELGQGVHHALALIVAEELDAAWDRVRVEVPVAHPAYAHPVMGRQRTTWSASVRGWWGPLRRAGAEARALLVAEAAARWQVPSGDCETRDGAVHHPSSGQSLGYGDLAEGAATRPRPRRVRLKSPAEFRLVGTDRPRLDLPSRTDGSARYALDVRPAGVHVAVVARPPALGTTLARAETGAARALDGVAAVVPLPSGVAVIARDTWTALRAREALDLTWDPGTPPHGPSIVATLRASAARVPEPRGRGRLVRAAYETTWLAHAPIEPMSCTAVVADGRCVVWSGTQDQTAAQEAAARASGLPLEQVTIHTTSAGGGFGRRAYTDFIEEAVAIARQSGVPVGLLWTREDDLLGDRFRPASAHVLAARLDDDGRPRAWTHRMAGGGGDGAMHAMAYDVGARDLSFDAPAHDIPEGIWRAVDAGPACFAIESFLDELAAAAGADPVEYRLVLLKGSPRWRTVLRVAAERAGWPHPSAPGRGLGVAMHEQCGSVVAVVAEVEASADATPRAVRLVAAIDCGIAVHPDGVRSQVEGAMVMGLGAALFERVDIEHGVVRQQRALDYRLARIADAPRLEVHIVPGDGPPQGVGEPGLPPVAPAVANAWCRLTGERLRSLPLITPPPG